jgi:hypothetical protein
MNPLRRTITISAVALGLGVSALSGTAVAEELPNDNWHIHDGGTGENHESTQLFDLIFGPQRYGTDAVPYVSCPDATDKFFLPNGANSPVIAAGVCMSDKMVVHLLAGPPAAPAGWSTLFDFVYYQVTYTEPL